MTKRAGKIFTMVMQDAVKFYSKRRNFINIIRIAVFGWLVIVTSFASACRPTPEGDSEAGRIAEARKFLKTMDLRALVDDLADNNVAARPRMDKDSFRAFVRREIRWSTLEETIIGALAKNFTASEIRTLTEFQNSPAGKSFIEKFPAYQAEVGPPLQAEIQRVLSAGEFARTRLHWDSPIQELTTGPADESLTAEFAFRNLGPQAIRFLSVATSCGCTTAKPEKTVYQPGERGTIRVILTKGNLVGLREERVFVTTDEPENPSVTLQLRVTISAPLKITPRLLVWGFGEKAAMKTIALEIPSGQAMDIIGIESVPDAFSAKTILDKGSQIFLVHIVPRTTARPMAGKFIVLAAAGAGKVLQIPVYLRILPPNAPPKGDGGFSWDDVLWIDAQSAAAYGRSHITGALPLTEEAWDDQFESILARWTPGKRIVVYCQPPGQAIQIIQRLKAYGLENLYVIAPGD
jgi:rhodanese-related sulfurtransferase